MKIMTWNVNGIRAAQKKGLAAWILKEKPDVLCLQEIKAKEDQVPEELTKLKGYHAIFNPAERPGYSGTAIFSRERPDEIWTKINMKEADSEGRVLGVRFGGVHVISAYYPNSQEGGARKDVKLGYCAAMLKKVKALVKKKQDVVLCGDYNIAHKEIDLARPKENVENPGFFPWEREAMTQFLDAGFHDIFREQHPEEKDQYTWWSVRINARERNIGWRIDYTCINPSLKSRAQKTFIQPEVMGSDHCPVGIVLK